MADRLVKWMIIASLILLGIALWRKDVLPDSQTLRKELLDEPVQIATRKAEFKTTVDGVEYKIQPLYGYEIYGMVMSKHDSDTWWDYIHKEWNDNLNVADLCVVWGSNVQSGSYQNISFSSGQFTCNFSAQSSEAFAAFDQTAISNNHLITDDESLAKKIRSISRLELVTKCGFAVTWPSIRITMTRPLSEEPARCVQIQGMVHVKRCTWKVWTYCSMAANRGTCF